jgi:hypothetical protein
VHHLMRHYALWAKRFQTLEIAAEICYVLGWVFLTLDILFLHFNEQCLTIYRLI